MEMFRTDYGRYSPEDARAKISAASSAISAAISLINGTEYSTEDIAHCASDIAKRLYILHGDMHNLLWAAEVSHEY